MNKDLSSQTALANPRCYDVGRKNMDLNRTEVWGGMFLRSLVHGVLLYLILTFTRPVDDSLDLYGSMIYLGLIAVVSFAFFWCSVLNSR